MSDRNEERPQPKHYQMALDVQNACNRSGVVHSFAELTEVLWNEAHALGEGTKWVNEHPICVLFADKISSLVTLNYDEFAYNDAYTRCMYEAKRLGAKRDGGE